LPTDVVVTEDTPGFVDLSSINFEDVDAGNNLIQVTLSTSNGGVLTASSDFDVTVFGSGFSTMTLQGGVSDLNNFFSSAFRFQYSNPTTHLAGDNVDTIQITVNDLGNIGSGGGTNIDFGTINVDITNVNDAPAGTDKTVATNEDNAYTFTTVDFGFSDTNDSPSDVLANILITTAPSNGSLYVDVNDDGLIDGGETLAATDTVALADITASLLKFKPLDNSNGMSYDSFTFQVQDDGGTINSGVDTDQSPNTITIDVIAVTDLSAVDDDFSNNEDIALNADVSTNDSTTSEGSLSYAVDTDVSNGTLVLNGDGSFTYTSDANYTGADSFTYTVTDADSGESSIQTVNLTVDPVTDLTAQNDSFSTSEDTVLNADVSSNDSTTSGGSLSYVVDTDVSNGTLVLNGDGTFSYTPDSNYTGSDSFTYMVTDADSSESDTRTVSLTVDPVTDLFAADDSFTANEDTALNADVSTNDSTTSGGSLSYTVDTDVSNGSLVLNGDGSFTYTPDANYTGSDSFSYTVTDADSGESSTQTVNLTVDPVADLSATDDAFSTIEETVLDADVSTNDSTTSGGSLSYAVDTDVSNGTLVLNGDGSFIYTPDSNYTGSDSFSYTVTDADSGESSTQTVSLTVNPVADLSAVNDAFSTNEDTLLNADVSTNDSTTSGGSLSYAVDTDVSNGTLVFNGDGSFTYTPDANYTGADSFTYTVTDVDGGESSTQTVSLTVDPVANLSATDDSFSTHEDTVLNADVSTNDSTTSGGSLSYALDTNASNGTVVVNANGTFTYTPDTNFNGFDSFTYTVTDTDSGESSTQTVNIVLTAVDDGPVISGDNAGALTEDIDPDFDTVLETSGTLLVTDPDRGESSFQEESIVGTYGNLSIGTAGNWSYIAENTQAAIQQLDTGEILTDILTVTTADGTTHDINITINGAEDAPVITGITSGTVAWDGTITAKGFLAISDVDTNDNPMGFPNQESNLGDNGYGSFVLTEGSWTYTLNNAAVQHLGPGQSVTDTITYTAMDGVSSITVTITINGAEEAPLSEDARTNTEIENGTDEVSDQVDDAANASEVLEEEASEHRPINSGLQSATEDSVWEEEPDVSRGEPIALPPLDDAALVSILTEVRQDSESKGNSLNAHTPITPKFIDLNHLDIAPFVLESPDPTDLQSIRDNDSFVASLEELDHSLDEAIEEEENQPRIEIESVIGLTLSLSAGFVAWVFRAGSLLASFMSVLPLWRQFDPLPILDADAVKRRAAHEDQNNAEKVNENTAVETIFDDEKSG
jgi:VCBS repeat-containing protein